MITSLQNPTVKRIRRLQSDRGLRWADRMMVFEGVNLADEALRAQVPVQIVLCTSNLASPGDGLVQKLAGLGAEIKQVSDAVMASCSDTESPQGILGVAPFPDLPLPAPLHLALVADRLSDPGNLGTMMRTALAAGVEALFLTEGGVDPYNPKVIRGGMGAHFRLPFRLVSPESLTDHLRGLDIWLAEARSGARYHEVDWTRPSALIVGSEAGGPQDLVREISWGSVHVPMAGESESLNAAISAAIILFEALRQRGVP
jgi:TrmH family RNA methyltransferase